jgi:PAS domain S-box-containing protein
LRTLRSRLIVLVLVAFAPGFWLLRNLAAAERAGREGAALEALRSAALQAKEQQQANVQAARGLLAAFAEALPVQEIQPEECSALARKLILRDPQFLNVAAARPDGQVFCNGTQVPIVRVTDRLYFQRALETLSFAAGEYQVGRATGRQGINFGAPALGDAGEVRAVVLASFDLEALERNLAKVGRPAGAVVLITDHRGRVLVGPASRGEPVPARLRERMQAEAGLAGPLPGPDGVDRRWAFEVVHSTPGQVAMRIAVGVPEAVLVAESRVGARTLALYGIVALAALAALVLASELLFVRRLEAVGRAASSLARGEYAARTGLPPAADEVGQLARSFDAMAGSLEALTRQHRIVLDAAGEGIAAVDVDRRISFANPAADRLLGMARGSAGGRSIHEFLPHRPPGEAAQPCAVCRAIETGEEQVSDDTFRRDGGASFPVKLVVAPIRERGAIAGAVLTFEDVTDRQRLELELRQAQKMDAVGQLTGGIAHDFNNLLTAMLSAGAFARDALDPVHPARADVDEFLVAARSAAELTKRLLAFSRRQVSQPRTIDLRAVAAGAGGMLRRLLGEAIELVESTPGAPCPVRADPALLEQVIVNLALNGRDAMARGGRLEIAVEEAPGGPGLPPGPLMVLRVADSGSGMDPDTLARAFEPFFTTKPAGRGTGLGLSTVYAIVRQAGGSVRLESAVGRGTTARVYLPRAEATPERLTPAPGSARSRRGGPERVLIVEDDEAIRRLARRTLEGAGYGVLEADRPSAARAAAAAGPIQLLLTDVVLPEEDGTALAASLTEANPGLRVLYMSGYTAGHLEAGEARLDFLPKPFTPEQLLASVRAALEAGPGKGSSPPPPPPLQRTIA